MQSVSQLSAPVGTTLSRFIAQQQHTHKGAQGELSQLLADISLAAKIINRDINRAGLLNLDGSIGSSNVQGEDQQKLDVIANTRFERALRNGGEVCCIISEELEEMIDTGNHKARYVVSMDPLDGSSNIGVNVSIGTIFSIFQRLSPQGSAPTIEDALQSGTAQIASGYVLYGSSTILVYTTGQGVNGFTYEPSLGEFFLSHPSIEIPEDGKIYSCNEGNFHDFPQGTQSYLEECRKEKLSGRYIGSLVADFHRNLLKGGIYLYPATSKAPDGKLRLQYECSALAYIVEQAGGMATDGSRRVMEIKPNALHQRIPLYIGSPKMVEKAMDFMQQD
ncbi:MAG: class 1 fructose-bisphosphatase [SAR324 cluster bacterium]|nr:class 1 fructose-bisphosphatase [SAR324 cluster bacterium]